MNGAENSGGKKKLKIALCAVNTRYSQSAAALDYLGGYLHRYLDSKNISRGLYELKTFEFNLGDTHEFVTRTLCSQGADIYGFSIYIWNRDFIKKVISFIRSAFPEALTLAGGPEAISVCRGDVEAMCGAEYAISGEGEISFARFVELAVDAVRTGGERWAMDAERLMQIDGIAHSPAGGGFRYSSEPAVVGDLDSLPSIFVKEGGPDARCGRNFVYLETSRGCPNHCHYCLSSLKPKNGPAVRYFSLERVFADIDRIMDDLKIDKVRVIDRTFNDDPERALAIFRYIASRARPDTLFQFEISPYKFTGPIVDFLKSLDRRCFQFEIGVQSFNRKALDSVGRVNSEPEAAETAPEEPAGRDPDKFETGENKTVQPAGGAGSGRAGDMLDVLINETKVNIHADLMYGLPGDNYDDCVNSFDTLLKKMPDSVQFWQLKLLRGTRLRENAAKMGLVYDPNPPYAVIKTPSISVLEMFRLQKLGRYLDIIYNHGHLKLSVRALFNFFARPSEFFFRLIEFFERNGIAETAISRQNLFSYVRRFAEETVRPASEAKCSVLLDCLRYDFIAGESKRFSLPDFLKPEKMRRDQGLFGYIQDSVLRPDSAVKLSRAFSLFRFDNDIVEAASGTELFADGTGFGLNAAEPSRRGAYMAVRHVANADGTFGSRRYWFNEPDDFLALDYFYCADKNGRFPPAGGDFDGACHGAFLEGFPARVEKYTGYGILISQNKSRQERAND